MLAEGWKLNEQFLRDAYREPLFRWMDNNPDNVGVFVVGFAADMIYQLSMVFGESLVDLLNLGAGAGKGTGWGYFEDTLRLFTVAAPLAKGVSKGIQLMSARSGMPKVVELGLARGAEAPLCTWVSSLAALRKTGTRHLATISDLQRVANDVAKATKGAIKPLEAAYIKEAVPILKALGAACKELKIPKTIGGIDEVIRNGESMIKRGGSYLIELKWKNDWGPQFHTIMAYKDKIKGTIFVDPSGASGKTLAEIEKKILQMNPQAQHFREFQEAVPQAFWIMKDVYVTDGLAGRIGGNNLLRFLAMELVAFSIPRPNNSPTPSPTPTPTPKP